jgi:hypothetical protein
MAEVLSYQLDTRFRGLILRPQDFHADETLALNQRKITALSVHLMFAFMGVNQLCKPEKFVNDRLKRGAAAMVEKPEEFKRLAQIMEDKVAAEDDTAAVI